MIKCLARYLPEASVTRLKPLGEGDFCVAYLLDDTWVIRKAKHEDAAGALVREACVLARIGPRLSVSVPQTQVLSTLESDGMVLSIHPIVKGEALTRDRWLDLEQSVKILLAKELGAFLRELHAVDRTEVGSCGLELLHFNRVFEELASRAEAAGEALPDPIRGNVAMILRRYPLRNLGWSEKPALLNRDISPEHVRSDGARISGVIDWGDVALGDPARDFIFLYEDWGDEFLALALEGYRAAKDEEFLARIYLHYLADQLSWTLQAGEEERFDDLRIGVAGLRRALQDLDAIL